MNGNGQPLTSPLGECGGAGTRVASLRRFVVAAGDDFPSGSQDYNHLLFLLEGALVVSCNEFSDGLLSGGEFILIPVAADTAYTVLSDLEALVFTFGEPVFRDMAFRRVLSEISRDGKGSGESFHSLPVREPLGRFLSSLHSLLQDGMDEELISHIKMVELFILLQGTYSPPELAVLLHPLAGSDPAFRLEVLRNYRKVEGVDDFAKRLGLEKRKFSRMFTDEFGTSPYRWLMERRAKHISFALRETDMSLQEIREKFGFRFSGHFTRFCVEMFGMTPLKLRRNFKQLKFEI